MLLLVIFKFLAKDLSRLQAYRAGEKRSHFPLESVLPFGARCVTGQGLLGCQGFSWPDVKPIEENPWHQSVTVYPYALAPECGGSLLLVGWLVGVCVLFSFACQLHCSGENPEGCRRTRAKRTNVAVQLVLRPKINCDKLLRTACFAFESRRRKTPSVRLSVGLSISVRARVLPTCPHLTVIYNLMIC